ncbi:Glutaredoxin-related protein 5, mitochondrial [Seminavis robusta]|uniref:Glutaredoxin-related protein 5, mitochondrial n=1 Tax=Seminavis robusta TaxID=568900 RepID=A0A9N8EU06_9STRA|nr:Glutaredoxin-related protein 5, mitochondrial [Seminavis robusta]|eukprot:Sro1948_g307230.1 Glutaredoxin-related protein 5, mitochondrial (171) ;mRNA; r:15556-16068
MLSNALRRCSTRSSLILGVSRTAVRSSLVAAANNNSHLVAVGTNPRFLSSDSHDDFAPQKKATVDGEEEAIAMIKSHVEGNRVMLYMKGNPSMPMCGFSARVVDVLKKEGADFSSVNVLDYPAIREGVKKFSEWPTIPQLYVNGEFIGGCDIITAMHESGELKEVLEEEK